MFNLDKLTRIFHHNVAPTSLNIVSRMWQFISFLGVFFLVNSQLAYAQPGTSIELAGSCISGSPISIPYVMDVGGKPAYDGTGYNIDGTPGLQISVYWSGTFWGVYVGGGTLFLRNNSNTTNPNSTDIEAWTGQGVFTCEGSMTITGDGTLSGSLPITLTDFQAERLGETIKLTWSTAIEQNNKGFEIEQSLDRESFEQIGFVEGAGNSSDEQKYEYTFQNPEAAYYRFKQVDLDGQHAYSPTRFIAAWEPVKDPFIYPNPIAKEVFIDNLAADQTLLVDIFDLQGRRVSIHEGRKPEVEQQLSEKFEGLTKGIYFVHIHTLSKSLVQQVIKE